MKSQAMSLKVWIAVILCFVTFQYFARLYFEDMVFNPGDSPSVSDGHFYRLERDFQNTNSDELKVAVIGSSRVARGIECPDEVRTILVENGMPPLQLNKIWESYDPFYKLVEDKNILKRLIPLKPDLICLQAEMLAIQMFKTIEKENLAIVNKYKRIWNLTYEGNKEKYIPKKLKYQSKVNQEIAYNIINANSLFKGEGPCTIYDNYAEMDTLRESKQKRNVKKIEDIRYTFDDLKMLNDAGIKIVIIDVPLSSARSKSIRTEKFIEDLQDIKTMLKDKFDINYWEYTGPPLYYRYYADGGHLGPEGRKVYTKWLLEKIHEEMPE